MESKTINGLDGWIKENPLFSLVARADELFWLNPDLSPAQGRTISEKIGLFDIADAEQRLIRFAPYLAKAFPETAASRGIIESALVPINKMAARLNKEYPAPCQGSLFLKTDNDLPISGSVKARGGIYEILKTAEEIAIRNKALAPGDNYEIFDSQAMKNLLSAYNIVVGSTGNLGLSIGIMSTRLGFKATVHMSADAKQWKKDLLRAKGATVIEHAGDYGQAVAQGRREAENDPNAHFVDDENSVTLFLGYAVAALRLQKQLAQLTAVDENHPLFVFIPCGVGGAPGGVTFGLRTIFGDNVHCFWAEPTQSPAMLVGLMSKKHNQVSVEDFGLNNKTEADGLAVGRPSGFVGKTLEKDISGIFTIDDQRLYRLLKMLADEEGIFLEPSALAAFPGPWLLAGPDGRAYLEKWRLADKMTQATNIIWATGGGMVPPEIMKAFYRRSEAKL